MTGLVLLAFFGTSVVAGGTVVTVAALRYARYLNERDMEEDRCPALHSWLRGPEKSQWHTRCVLRAEHDGPHKVSDPRANHQGEDYWWTDAPTKPALPVGEAERQPRVDSKTTGDGVRAAHRAAREARVKK